MGKPTIEEPSMELLVTWWLEAGEIYRTAEARVAGLRDLIRDKARATGMGTAVRARGKAVWVDSKGLITVSPWPKARAAADAPEGGHDVRDQ